MFRSLVFRFFAAFSSPIHEEKDLKERQIESEKGSASITLTDRSAIKREAIKEWSKPENIAKRIEELEKEAPKALERAKEMSKKIREQFNLPSDDPLLPENLPKHMRGQSPSTVRAMLRQEEYEYDRELLMWKKK